MKKNRTIKPLPEFIQFKNDMEKSGEIVVLYDDGTPFVHTLTPAATSKKTAVRTEFFSETFDPATKCLYPVTEGYRSVIPSP